MNACLSDLQWTLTRLFHSRAGSMLIAFFLFLQRSPALRWISALRNTSPPAIIQAGLRWLVPASVGAGSLHTLSGATVVQPVPPSSNPALAKVGEPFVWVFRTSGHEAKAYTITGLPPGVNHSGVIQHGVSSLMGTPTTPGLFQTEIVGHEKSSGGGGRTPAYRLVINVEAGLPPSIVAQPRGGDYEAGVDVMLEVGAEGGVLNYRWLRDGRVLDSEVHTLIDPRGARDVLIPTADPGPDWRTVIEDFDLSGWRSGSGGVGFEVPNETTYDPFIGLDVEASMRQRSTSALIRMSFAVDAVVHPSINELKLGIQYDDGFAMHLNGAPVLAANSAGTPAWNAGATGNRDDSLAVTFQDFDLTSHLDELLAGQNLLAVQGLNQRVDSDFLINLRLEGLVRRDLPVLRIPNAQPRDSGVYQVEVRSGNLMVKSDPVELHIRPRDGFASWQNANWSAEEIAQPEIGGPLGDPDHDGKSNIEEFATGYDPRTATPGPSLSIERDSGSGGWLLRISWTARQAGVDYLFQRAVDPAAGIWETLVDGSGGVEYREETGGLTALLPPQPADIPMLFRALFRLQ